MREIKQDPFYGLIANYPDCVVDYCLVTNAAVAEPHREALNIAANRFSDPQNPWTFDISRARARKTEPEELFRLSGSGGISYAQAFLSPPHGSTLTETDFSKINSVLFPLGTEALEVFQWTTDWSDYFLEGHEWWGSLCLTVYDKKCDRFVVMMASATD